MYRFIIEKHTHGFHVRVPGDSDRRYVFHYCRDVTEYEWKWDSVIRKKKLTPKKTFAVSNPQRDTFGFLISQLPNFLAYLKRFFSDHEISVTDVAMDSTPEKITFDLPGISPRGDTQVKAIQFVLDKYHGSDSKTAILPLPTGQGKTLTTLQALMRIGVRTAFVMGARHLLTWRKTITDKTDCKKTDIVIVRSQDDLRSVINMANSGELKYKFLLFSSQCINGFINAFTTPDDPEYFPGDSYEATPSTLYSILGVGLEVTDECHELIHQVVRRFILLDVPFRIPLSATLDPPGDFAKKLYTSAFPDEYRFKGFKQNSHITARPFIFYMNDPKNKIKYQGSRGYSHATLEASIMKSPDLMADYLDMTWDLFLRGYVEERRPKTKALIFASTIAMCSEITKYFSTRLEREGIDISIARYVSEDPDSVLTDFELIVSTPGSCGTGKDIPNLLTTICTVAVSSNQLTEQIMGRLRELVDYPDVSPIFYYYVCASIGKHLSYDQNHRAALAPKTKVIEPVHSGIYLNP